MPANPALSPHSRRLAVKSQPVTPLIDLAGEEGASRVFGAHRALSRTFPFAIYYDVIGDTAHVKAVLDCRRAPKWIQKKLRAT